MSGLKLANVVFDTNAFIYFIGGDSRLKEYINSTIFISEFTEMELKGHFGISQEELKELNKILEDFIILPFNNEIKERAISIRHKNKLKLPDALIVPQQCGLTFLLLLQINISKMFLHQI